MPSSPFHPVHFHRSSLLIGCIACLIVATALILLLAQSGAPLK